jgi:death-on-curing protein
VSEPVWLPVNIVIGTNKDIVTESGEPFSILNRGSLEGAVARPKQHYHVGGETDLAILATVLLFGIARSHPFAQGNKRTAFLCARMFLERNGYLLRMPDDEAVARSIVLSIENRLPEDEFARLIRPYLEPYGE